MGEWMTTFDFTIIDAYVAVVMSIGSDVVRRARTSEGDVPAGQRAVVGLWICFA
jgi:hypothetical protein